MPTILDEVTFRKLVIRALLVIIIGLFGNTKLRPQPEAVQIIVKDLQDSIE